MGGNEVALLLPINGLQKGEGNIGALKRNDLFPFVPSPCTPSSLAARRRARLDYRANGDAWARTPIRGLLVPARTVFKPS